MVWAQWNVVYSEHRLNIALLMEFMNSICTCPIDILKTDDDKGKPIEAKGLKTLQVILENGEIFSTIK